MRLISVLLPLCSISAQAFGADKLYVGLTASDKRIEALVVEGAPVAAPTILLIGGLAGQDESSQMVLNEVRSFDAGKKAVRPFRLLAIPVANPEKSMLQFPPEGVAYRENPESYALWRWIALQGPDLVLIAGLDSGLANALSRSRRGRHRLDSGARDLPLQAGILKPPSTSSLAIFGRAPGTLSAPKSHSSGSGHAARRRLWPRPRSAGLHPGHRADGAAADGPFSRGKEAR